MEMRHPLVGMRLVLGPLGVAAGMVAGIVMLAGGASGWLALFGAGLVAYVLAFGARAAVDGGHRIRALALALVWPVVALATALVVLAGGGSDGAAVLAGILVGLGAEFAVGLLLDARGWRPGPADVI